MISRAFLEVLERRDVAGYRKLSREFLPQYPQPESAEAAEAAMHIATTQTGGAAFKARAYSHAWLLERGLPSMLPDELRPKAQRVHPVTVKAVGISVNFRSRFMKGAENQVRGVMEDAVLDAYANGDQDREAQIKRNMLEARDREMRALFGV